MILGVDPGLQGALVWISEGGGLLKHARIPIAKVGSKRHYNGAALLELLETPEPPRMVVIERLAARQTTSGTTGISMGRSLGRLEGMCDALRYPYETVPPATWKRKMLGTGSEPATAPLLAAQRWPELAAPLSVKAAWGIADAAWIAEWWRRSNLTG